MDFDVVIIALEKPMFVDTSSIRQHHHSLAWSDL